ncbi:aldo/keto reductase [Kineococcus glutinatus]|uniref:Aldo/keto reductase n=1 Tax=Kineococcus glutinatus TaxID=1070872 RepID=A0ABP8VEW3_9ACTN
MNRIGTSELHVTPLCLGANPFGWTADEATSHAVLDAYVGGGGNFVDTADVYGRRPGGERGEASEEIIGSWFERSGRRDDVVLATKVGKLPGAEGLSAATIRRACDASLRRLRTDRIDLYWAHADDPDTPLEETLGAFDELVTAGKVRHVAASIYDAPRLEAALGVSRREGFTPYVALQNHYNLLERSGYEGRTADVVAAEGLSAVPYFALAMGFLTGKYRPGTAVDSVRSASASRYLEDPRGLRVLAALDDVAAAHAVPVTAVSLAWLAAQETVAAPIASARTPEQVPDLLAAVELELTGEELAHLTAASS